MNFNKQMIDLVREIRRRVPSDDKPGIKLANPDLLHELIPIFQFSTDTVTKTLIKELFSVAGDGWPERLVEKSFDVDEDEYDNEEPKKRYITKTYRGQTELVEVNVSEEKPQIQRIYRGQLVSS
ncbi:hypothetical protein [Pseudomaricurvus sp.]|uniref:hypothetical protein n=1 Tax=Pseudomaricurvus sp. TaxID=2004510 RepID=UPI003F6CA4B5